MHGRKRAICRHQRDRLGGKATNLSEEICCIFDASTGSVLKRAILQLIKEFFERINHLFPFVGFKSQDRRSGPAGVGIAGEHRRWIRCTFRRCDACRCTVTPCNGYRTIHIRVRATFRDSLFTHQFRATSRAHLASTIGKLRSRSLTQG